MKLNLKLILLFLPLLSLSIGCKKETKSEDMATPKPSPATETVAPPVADASAAATEAAAKMDATKWAMKQDEIKNDPQGQWAIQATASSTYNDAAGTAGYSANQATGAPNVDKYADDGHAWAPQTPDAGVEWLDLKFPKPVSATEVRVRESCGSGAVVKVEIYDDQGLAHAVWQGNDPTKDLNYLIVTFPKTTFKTDHVKITLATNVVPGWNEIDAVQLVGSD